MDDIYEIKKTKETKNLQESQYQFPYHHIPQIEEGYISHCRSLGSAFSYMALLLEVRERIIDVNPKNILDVGCGDGRLLGLLPDEMTRVGIDLSERAINFARGFHPEIKFKSMDISNINEKFEVLVATEVLEHIPDKNIKEFIKNMGQIITENGHLIVTVPTDNRPVLEKHFRHYSKSLLHEHLGVLDDNFEYETMIPLLKTKDYIYKFFQKISFNRFWTLESPLINKIFWKYYQKFCIDVDETEGIHWLAVLVKSNG